MSEHDPASGRLKTEDIDAWLATLAGHKDAGHGDMITLRLRTVLKAREAPHQRERYGLEALLERLEHEGLITPSGHRPQRRFSFTVSLATAATLAGLGVLIGVLWPGQAPMPPTPSSEAVRFRGFGTEVTVVSAEPAHWIEETEQALEHAGCAVTRPLEAPLVLIVDAAEPCLMLLNQQLGERATPLTQPGRYRLVIEESPRPDPSL